MFGALYHRNKALVDAARGNRIAIVQRFGQKPRYSLAKPDHGRALGPVSRLHAKKPTTIAREKVLASHRNFSGLNAEVLRQRQMMALQLRHDAGLTDKVIGRAIRRHPDTIGNWRTGKTELKLRDLLQLDAFFSSLGDWQFLEAICGELAVRRRRHAKQLQDQAAVILEQTQWLDLSNSRQGKDS